MCAATIEYTPSFRDGPKDQTRNLEIPGSRFACPGMTNQMGPAPSQPPLPSLKTLQVLEALALVAGAAEIKLLDVLIVAQLVGAAVKHHLALLHDVAVTRHRECRARVLFHQQDRDAEIPVDLGDDPEHFLDPQRRQAHR